MPMFTASSPYDGDVERATSELNVNEDPNLFREICERVKHTGSSEDCLRAIVKRMNHKVPHVAMQALALLDACVTNCGFNFKREMSTPDFISECRTFINSGKAHQKVVQRLKMLVKKWAETEFKDNKQLSLFVSMYTSLKTEGHSFNFEEVSRSGVSGTSVRNEDDDLAKAIALSLKDSGRHSTSKVTQSSLYPSTTSSAYPSLSTVTTSASASSAQKEPRKVRTLYDFEAAEDNELTFKAGEIICVLDDSDPNWWKGSSYRGEGLFPANFVTADLTAEPEHDSYAYKSRKSVHFREEVEVKVMEPTLPVLEIDEVRIDAALALIQNADPTGESQADSDELLRLEDQCQEMGPLIDQELEKIDRQHNSLIEYNTRLMEAFQLYNSLMTELPSYGYVAASNPAPSQPSNLYGGQSYGHGPPSFPAQGPQQAMHGPPLPAQPGLPPTGYVGPPQAQQPASAVDHNSPYHHQQQQQHPDSLQQYASQIITPNPSQASYSQQYASYSSSTGYSANPTYAELHPSGIAVGGGAPVQHMQQPVAAQSLL